MTSESDDLKLQKLIDVSFINFRSKTKAHNAMSSTSTTDKKYLNRSNYALEKKEIEDIQKNLRNLYWEIDILNELNITSLIGNRVIESIKFNLNNQENSLLTRISLLNIDIVNFNNLSEENSEKLKYQQRFLEMILGNLNELQKLEVGKEYLDLNQDMKNIKNLIYIKGEYK